MKFGIIKYTNYAYVLSRVICLIIPLLLCSCTDSPLRIQYLREGNKSYDKKDYDNAVSNYMKALNEDNNYFKSHFNLGDALYMKKDTNGAQAKFESALLTAKDKSEKFLASYNSGNTNLDNKKYEPAIEAYKNALKNNPYDKDAKYNLSYALAKHKKEQEQNKKNKQNKNNKENKDNKQQNKNQDNKQQKSGDKEQQKKDNSTKEKNDGDKGKEKKPENGKQDQNNKEKSNGDKDSKMSDEQAKKILIGLKDSEKKVQKKMLLRAMKEKQQSQPKTQQW